MILDHVEELFRVTPLTVITALSVVVLTLSYLILKDRNLPPGPIGLPLVGYYPFLKDDNLHLQLHKLAESYGDVLSIRVGGKLFILLGSINAIKEAHLKKSDSFAARYTDYSSFSIGFGKGIITRNGEEWRIIRKFFVQAFREYGLSSFKDYMSDPIYGSVNATIESLKESNGSTVNIIPILNNGTLAIFRRIMFNDNGITDEEIQDVLDAYSTLMYLFVGKRLFLVGEFARKYMFPRAEKFKEAVESVTVLETNFKRIIKRHEESFDRNNIRDIIDSFINERKNREDKGDPTAEYFSDDGLVGSLIEFVGDGISSISIFITLFIYALLEHPEEQEKIYKEIVDVVGTDGGVTLEDRINLPYTNAFIHEVIRTTDFFTYFTSLECTKETTLNGYKIPVGAITVTNFWTSHHDPLVFEDPEAFKPSRYMPVEGKPKSELPIIFGVGKRSCAGESFTMMQVFLFLTAIVKNFRLARPEGDVKKFFFDGEINIRAYPRQ